MSHSPRPLTRGHAGSLIAPFVLALAIGLTAPLTAVANEWAEPGAFVTVAGMNAFENFQNTPEDFTDSWAFALRAGYRFNGFLAAEGGFEFLTGFKTLVDLPPGQPVGIPNPAPLTVDGGIFTVNAKAYAPWFGRFQPYGLVGVGGMWAKLRTSWTTGAVCTPSYFGWWCEGTYTKLGNNGAFVAKFGGGAEFFVTEDFALVMDAAYVMPTGALKDLQYTSFTWGAIFKF